MYLSLLLGTIFHKLNRHQSVKNFDVYKHVDIFNLMQVFSYKLPILDYGTGWICVIFYLLLDHLNLSSLIHSGPYWYTSKLL
jgi:hypothetical protein